MSGGGGGGVIDACLEYALSERIEHGVWGGESERGRRRILRNRRATANQAMVSTEVSVSKVPPDTANF